MDEKLEVGVKDPLQELSEPFTVTSQGLSSLMKTSFLPQCSQQLSKVRERQPGMARREEVSLKMRGVGGGGE